MRGKSCAGRQLTRLWVTRQCSHTGIPQIVLCVAKPVQDPLGRPDVTVSRDITYLFISVSMSMIVHE